MLLTPSLFFYQDTIRIQEWEMLTIVILSPRVSILKNRKSGYEYHEFCFFLVQVGPSSRSCIQMHKHCLWIFQSPEVAAIMRAKEKEKVFKRETRATLWVKTWLNVGSFVFVETFWSQKYRPFSGCCWFFSSLPVSVFLSSYFFSPPLLCVGVLCAVKMRSIFMFAI